MQSGHVDSLGRVYVLLLVHFSGVCRCETMVGFLVSLNVALHGIFWRGGISDWCSISTEVLLLKREASKQFIQLLAH